MARLTRDKFIPLIDISKITGGASPAWKPIDLSTVFELDYNPNTETYSYICYANDDTEITGYAPTMAQEIVLDSANPIYNAMLKFFRSMPVGSAAKVPICIVYPDADGKPTDGDLFKDGAIQPDNINTVDGKLNFTLNLNGAVTPATVAGAGADTITVTEKAA